jgi:hypothetical protein
MDFMTDPDNLEVPSRRERKILMVRSLLNVQLPQPEWDEAMAEDDSGVITMDVLAGNMVFDDLAGNMVFDDLVGNMVFDVNILAWFTTCEMQNCLLFLITW